MQELRKQLEEAMNRADNEDIHVVYDEMIEKKLKEYNPSFVRRLKTKIKDFTLWYA